MVRWLFGYKQIARVEEIIRARTTSMSPIDKRPLVEIAVIDDEPLAAQQTLLNSGYNIKILGDIKSLNEVKSYSIILCDIQGVGAFFQSANQGAYIINEIKRNHPEKFVIAYTGGSLSSDIMKKANESADLFLAKDADIEEWRDKLDKLISFVTDPVETWKRQRMALVDADASTFDILKLEDAYVRSLEQRKIDPFAHISTSSKISSDARSIAQSLVASAIFKILVG